MRSVGNSHAAKARADNMSTKQTQERSFASIYDRLIFFLQRWLGDSKLRLEVAPQPPENLFSQANGFENKIGTSTTVSQNSRPFLSNHSIHRKQGEQHNPPVHQKLGVSREKNLGVQLKNSEEK
jgi:hypothetical protein